jgi:hypothetical protein
LIPNCLYAQNRRMFSLNLKSEVEERFLRSGTAKAAVPTVEMTKLLGALAGQNPTSAKLGFHRITDAMATKFAKSRFVARPRPSTRLAGTDAALRVTCATSRCVSFEGNFALNR